MRVAVIAIVMVSSVASAEPQQRSASEYLPSTAGTVWVYDGPLGPAETVTVQQVAKDGTITILNVDMNKQSSTYTWRLVAGAWTELFSARGKDPVVVLPAALTKGAKWKYTYTDMLGTSGTHSFEVKSLNDTLTLKDGSKHTGLLRVDEKRPDLGDDMPVVHYYEPGKGEIASKVGESWFRSLSKWTPPKKKS